MVQFIRIIENPTSLKFLVDDFGGSNMALRGLHQSRCRAKLSVTENSLSGRAVLSICTVVRGRDR